MRRALLVLVAGVVAYFAAAVVLGVVPANRKAPTLDQGIEILLLSNGIHVDIGVPVTVGPESWQRFLADLDLGVPLAEPMFVAFGWGERRFFLETPTWADLEASVAIPAVFWPTPAALHVTLLPAAPQPSERTRRAFVAEENYPALVAHLRSGFQIDDRGHPIPIDCCRYAGAFNRFYEASGSYDAVRTSNSWTNRGLRRAGLRTARWAPFERSIFHHFPAP